MMYGWTKWGGPTDGLVKEVLMEWNCQICGQTQLCDFPQYLFPIDNHRRDFIRICVGCKADLEVAGIKTYLDLAKQLESFKKKRRVSIINVELLKTSY